MLMSGFGQAHSSQQPTIYTSIKLPQKLHLNRRKLPKFPKKNTSKSLEKIQI